ncbi:hypothetical protein [Corynebacterium sp. A21]|uniref:hypothetical protein n=1 Tax=Corynebacterium sp. A21 TaxID=3457318 RepID=UPI003FD3AAEA
MSAHSHAANQEVQDFPDYQGRLHYIDGYLPASLNAPHSSLERSSTWIGMGLVLVCLFGFGMLIYGGATQLWGGDDYPQFFMISGAILGVVGVGTGFVLISRGRAGYKKYVKTTGRTQ